MKYIHLKIHLILMLLFSVTAHAVTYDEIFKALSQAKNYEIPLEQAIQNFQDMLSHDALKALNFKFPHDFNEHPELQDILFQNVHSTDNPYQFYYDTGAVWSNSRGIALTNNTLIWKNVTGKVLRVYFKNIRSLSLRHHFTGWTVILNHNEDYGIRLSSIKQENVLSFVTAMVYFINFHKNRNEGFVNLDIPADARQLFATTWTERKRDNFHQMGCRTGDFIDRTVGEGQRVKCEDFERTFDTYQDAGDIGILQYIISKKEF
ncbi:MAG: hypothetical protein KAH77_08705 [Thiomargarita sp.]|nr:hypothetical protein [Thiomargarita sp.]